MIKINLLPHKEERRLRSGQQQLILFATIIFLEIIAFSVWNYFHSSRLKEVQSQLKKAQVTMNDLNKEKEMFKQQQERQAKMKEQQDIFKQLKDNQTGPASLLQYLSFILWPVDKEMKELDSLIQQEKDRIKNGQPAMYTKDQMDQYQKRYESLSEMVNAQESAGWKVTWNPMSIYILSFVEKNYKVTIDGVARTNADVAEFLNRLQDGIFFISPEPGNLLIKTDKATKTEMINFKFTSMVNYSAGKKG